MEIILVRHGKTNENIVKNLSGNSNKAQLSEEGKKHAATLVTLFLSDGIERIFASPLDRAMDTAEPIAKALKLEIAKNDLLREFDFGDLDGTPETGEGLQGLVNRRESIDYRFPNGESYRDILARGKKFVEDLLEKKEKKILIVAHAGVNRAILANLMDLGEKNIDTINCPNSLVYIFDPETNKLRWADTKNNERGEGLLFRTKV